MHSVLFLYVKLGRENGWRKNREKIKRREKNNNLLVIVVIVVVIVLLVTLGYIAYDKD